MVSPGLNTCPCYVASDFVYCHGSARPHNTPRRNSTRRLTSRRYDKRRRRLSETEHAARAGLHLLDLVKYDLVQNCMHIPLEWRRALMSRDFLMIVRLCLEPLGCLPRLATPFSKEHNIDRLPVFLPRTHYTKYITRQPKTLREESDCGETASL